MTKSTNKLTLLKKPNINILTNKLSLPTESNINKSTKKAAPLKELLDSPILAHTC